MRRVLRFASPSDQAPDCMLGAIAAAVEDLGAHQGWNESVAFKVNLVLEELTTNIVTHGGAGAGAPPAIEIGLACGESEVVIEVSDDGPPFDPLTEAPPPPSIDRHTVVAPVGGLGVHLVKRMMDTLSYRHEDGRNHLIMTCRLSPCMS